MAKNNQSTESTVGRGRSPAKKGSTTDYPMVDLRDACEFVQTIREKALEAETMPIVAKACGYASPTSSGFYRRMVAARLFQLIQPQGAALTQLALDYFKPDLGDAKSSALKRAARAVASYQPLLEKYVGKKLAIENVENAITRSTSLSDECALLCAKCFVQSLRFAGELDGDDVLFAPARASEPTAIQNSAAPISVALPLPSSGDVETYSLTLDANRKRRVVVQAPPAVTPAELKRIQDWLSFQLLVAESNPTGTE